MDSGFFAFTHQTRITGRSKHDLTMLGFVIVYAASALGIIGAIVRPYIGMLVFYAFVFLEPEWNWRWVIARDAGFQRYLAGFTILGWLLHGGRFPRRKTNVTLAMMCLLLFLILAWISSFFTISVPFTEFYMGILWKIIAMSLLAIAILDSERKIVVLAWVIVFCQGYNAYQINLQYFTDGFCRFATQSNWGYKGDNNLYSIFTLPAAGLAAGFAMFSKTWKEKAIAGFILLLQAHQVMLLESRGGMLGGIAMIAFLIYLVPKTSLNLTIVGVGLILGSVLVGPPVVKEFMSSFESSDSLDSSASSRFSTWKAGMDITLDYPLFGVGPYAGQVLVPQYYEKSDRKDAKGLHNLFFEISSGCGIPAVILYFSFFGIIAFSSWKLIRRSGTMNENRRAVLTGALVGNAGYLVSSMFSSGALLESSYICASLSAAILLVEDESLSDSSLLEFETTDNTENEEWDELPSKYFS
jgi:O-antigen ligase